MKILYKHELDTATSSLDFKLWLFFFRPHLKRPFRRLSKASGVITPRIQAIIHIFIVHISNIKKNNYICIKTPCWGVKVLGIGIQFGVIIWQWKPCSLVWNIRPCRQSWSYWMHNLVKLIFHKIQMSWHLISWHWPFIIWT